MTLQETVTKVKVDLRISHTALDEDIKDMIAACLKDLEVSGIVEPNPADPLIMAALKVYMRAAYSEDTKKAEVYQERYNGMKAFLMLAGGYGSQDE